MRITIWSPILIVLLARGIGCHNESPEVGDHHLGRSEEHTSRSEENAE